MYVYVSTVHTLLQFGRDRLKGIRAPKLLPKMATISVCGVLQPNYGVACAAAYGCDIVTSLVTFALDELAVREAIQSTRTANAPVRRLNL